VFLYYQWYTTGGIYLVNSEEEMKYMDDELVKQQTVYENYGDFSLWKKQKTEGEKSESHEMGEFLETHKEHLPLFKDAIGGFHQVR